MAVASATTSSGLKAPSSTFAELLRRSRFSSYDPSIAQTYTSPPASARRGNYGLKRPIPMPYKDSYIALPTFEHHGHFADWNNAETQVKFVKRVEEMGVLPRYLPGSSWEKGLGEARTQWLVDSEFAENTHPGGVQAPAPAPPLPLPKVDTVDTLDAYGKQGPGGYGSKRPPPKSLASASSSAEPDGNHLQVNIESLSPKQFQRYLEKIRQLGPEFREYLFNQQCSRVEAQLRASSRAQGLPEPTQEEIKAKIEEDELLLFIASQNSSQKLHRRFLNKTFAKDYKEPQHSYKSDNNAPAKIEAQPHRNGALTYTHFSPLDSLLTTPPQPGLVLQPEPRGPQRGFYNDAAKRGGHHYQDQKFATYIALFGGLTAKLQARNAGVKVPLYNPEKYLRDDSTAGATAAVPLGTTPEALEKSSGMFRMTRIAVRAPPKVVGYAVHKKRPKALLDEMSLDTECVTELPWSQRNLVNPYRPGSYEYSAHQQVTVHNRMLGAGRYSVGNVVGGGTGGGRGGFSYLKLREKDRENSAKKALRGWGAGGGKGAGGADQEFGKSMAKTLSGIVNSAGRGSE